MRPKVLLISQDAGLKERTRSCFSRRGCCVLCADTGMRGLNIARLSLPDVIVLDDELPDLDGFSVCGLLRTQVSTRHVPVIILLSPAKSKLCDGVSAPDAPQFLPRNLAPEALQKHVLYRLARRLRPGSLRAALSRSENVASDRFPTSVVRYSWSRYLKQPVPG